MTKKYIDKVSLEELYLEKLPDLSDVTCRGDFNCSRNQLTSLEGVPKEVGGDFDCSYNQVTSLEGAPKEVQGGDFDCSSNQLTSLKGVPKEVGGSFFVVLREIEFTEEDVRAVCDVKGDVVL
jgi:hypothetical protein